MGMGEKTMRWCFNHQIIFRSVNYRVVVAASGWLGKIDAKPRFPSTLAPAHKQVVQKQPAGLAILLKNANTHRENKFPPPHHRHIPPKSQTFRFSTLSITYSTLWKNPKAVYWHVFHSIKPFHTKIIHCFLKLFLPSSTLLQNKCEEKDERKY